MVNESKHVERYALEDLCPTEDRSVLKTMLESALWHAQENLTQCLNGDHDPGRLIAIGAGIKAVGRLLYVLRRGPSK